MHLVIVQPTQRLRNGGRRFSGGQTGQIQSKGVAVGLQPVQFPFPVFELIDRRQIGAGSFQRLSLFGAFFGILTHLLQLFPALGQFSGLKG